jgi:hypothetical protein
MAPRALAVVAVLILLLGSVSSDAAGRGGGYGRGGHAMHGGGGRGHGWHGARGHWGGHHGHHRGCCWSGAAFVGGFALGGSLAYPYAYPYYPYYPYPLVFSYPPYVARSPVYPTPLATTQPADRDQLIHVSSPPAGQPQAEVQREVAYPHGKYVLHGDGVTQPWQWVWFPASWPASGPTVTRSE